MAYSNKDFKSKGFKENIRKYENAKRKNVSVYMESDDLIDIAEFYYKNGDIDQAIEVINYTVELFPCSTMPFIFRSRIALLDENNIQLAKQYAEMVSDKSNLDYIYLLAEIMIIESYHEDANHFLKAQMAKIDTDDIPDFVLDIATIFTDYNLYDLADSWLSLSDEPDLADYKELKGRIASGKGNYEEAERIFEELLDEDPFSSQVWNDLASTQLMHNRIEESIASSEFSIAINPKDEEAILNKANGLFNLGNYGEALKYYKCFTRLRPQEDTGYMFQGNALLNMNRPKDAVLLYNKAEEKAQKNAANLSEIYQELAFTHSILGNLDKALEYVAKAENTTYKDNKSEILVLRGHIFLDHNRAEEAQECFQQAMIMSNYSKRTFLHIAISIFDCNYFEIAYKMFKTIDFKDGVNEGSSYMALCCKHLNKDNEFLEYLSNACNKNPHEARLVLGHLFPKDMDVRNYYKYMYDKLKK